MGSTPVKYVVVSTEQIPSAPTTPTMALQSISTLLVTALISAASGLSGAQGLIQKSSDGGKTWTTIQTLSISGNGSVSFTTINNPPNGLIRTAYTTTTGTFTAKTTMTANGTL